MFWSRARSRPASQRQERADADDGLIARLVWSTLFYVSLGVLPLLAFIYVALDAWNLIPIYDVPGSIFDLAKQLIVGMCVVLVTYICTYLLYRRHHEILTRGEIERISDRVARQVIEAAGAAPLDNHLFRNRKNVESLTGEPSELWISRETGSSLFAECAEQISTLLQNGCRFKVVLTDPNGPGAAHTDLRNAGNAKGPVQARSQKALETIRRILNSGEDHRNRFQLRFTPYALPATAIIANPGSKLGGTKVHYRTIGHLAEQVDQRISFATDRVRSPLLTGFIEQEFERIFRASSKVVLIPDVKKYTDWQSLFPSFFRRQTTGEFDSDRLFLVIFNPGAAAAGMIQVRYGTADSAAIERTYATASAEGPFSVSRETFVDLRIAIDRAVVDNRILLFGNLGPVALGDDALCEKTEITAHDVELPKPEHQAYLASKLSSGTGSLQIRLQEPILELMTGKLDSHLYVHFASLTGPGKAKSAAKTVDELVQQIRGHERTTLVAAGGAGDQLAEELRGSLRARSFG